MEAVYPYAEISIHTTTQVVTEHMDALANEIGISIHTTTQVVTQSLSTRSMWMEDFNPHHHAGGDLAKPTKQMRGYIFQSTPPRRW